MYCIVLFIISSISIQPLASVVVLEESPGPLGSLKTNLQVLALGPQVLVFVLGSQSSQKLSRTSHMITWSINSVTATVHEVTVNNRILTDIRYTYQ